jgi:adenylate kinase family enzyme
MMKLIYLVGNMCAGKSTLARGICEVLPQYKHFEIDSYRCMHQADIMAYEVEAWEHLASDLLASEYAILDSTGVGLRAKEILELAQETQRAEVLTIMLDVSIQEARQRFEERQKGGYEQPPFPYSTTRWDSFARIESKVIDFKEQTTVQFGMDDQETILTLVLDEMIRRGFH